MASGTGWCQKRVWNFAVLCSDPAQAHSPSPLPGKSGNWILRSLYEFPPLKSSLGGNLVKGEMEPMTDAFPTHCTL